MMSMRDVTQNERELYFVSIGGFDTHQDTKDVFCSCSHDLTVQLLQEPSLLSYWKPPNAEERRTADD